MDRLPVQYEDFFVLSVGNVDNRPSYHNANQIWPAGYRSCWHDKVTGSLFICDVSDGGDSGPVFRVSRCSCSTVPIPNGSTVIFMPNPGQSYWEDKEKNDDLACVNMDYDEYCSVQMLLSDTSPPQENDVLSCLGSYSDKSSDVQASNCLQLEAYPLHKGFGNGLSDTDGVRDEIGEFFVEESSSSSAWRMVAKKFVDTCRQIYMKRGTLKLFCEHVVNETPSTFLDCTYGKDDGRFTSLARFFGSSRSIKIPYVIKDTIAFETGFEVLLKWLDQDRFGLDIEFVQEIIEQLPGVCACLQYVLLKERINYSSSITVGNGILLVKTKDGVQGKDERARSDMVEDPATESRCLPPGKPVSLKLPVEIVGDVLQVWEFLCRFYEVLGLEDPLSIKELEQELVCPWFNGLNLLEEVGGKIGERCDVTSPRTVGSSQHIVPSSTESGAAVTIENPDAFTGMKTEATKEANEARMESDTYSRWKGNALIMAYRSVLKVLICELQSKVSAVMGPKFDTGESKLKRGKKKDMDSSVGKKGTKLNMLPINELTWPELVRRYILAVLSMDGNIDYPEIASRESGKVFRCLLGDGGVLCGALTGVVGMEADAVLLAQAMKNIFGCLSRENDMLRTDDGGSDATGACESIALSDNNIPEWALLLEPVRKLPTNVGARIRKCVNDALEKGPPEWAKKILEHSISKGVYKGNASGPTKKAVVSVLAEVHGEGMAQKPHREKKMKNFVSIADMMMKQCRIILRRVASADSEKVFCNLLGRRLLTSSDNDDEGILESPAMISRSLDFRTIDLRLAAGAYGGSHDAFLEDVRELWTQLRTCHSEKPDLVQLAETLSSNFESLYAKEVVSLFQKFVGYAKLGCLSAELKKEIDDFLVSSSELPKAPWEEGVCKVCGIDKDDVSVLLCDTCDAEYHTYCLSPPLPRIPQGNWYCPSCVASKHNVQDASECISIVPCNRKKYQGEFTCVYFDTLEHLASVLEEKECWEFSVDEKTFLLKFLSDELLNSVLIRQHLEHGLELSAELQQKLRSVSMEWRNLKSKEETLAANLAKTGKCPYFRSLEEKSASKSLSTEPLDAEDRLKDGQLSGNFLPPMNDIDKDKPFRQKEVLPSNTLQQETNGLSRGNSFHGGMKQRDDNSLELNSVRNEISHLQGSVRSIEVQLLKLSLRGDFLGSDSVGRLYWVLAKLSRHPWVIVNCREMTPYMHNPNDANTTCFPWVTYQSDAEIKGLVEYLRCDDPKERELKESILRWLKLRSLDSEHNENRSQDEPQMASSGSTKREIYLYSESLVTKAGSLLVNKYGPWSEPDIIDLLKKRGRKTKPNSEDKMFRCYCLEPVWPSRYHCISCHRTFSSEVELDGHNDAACKLGIQASKKSNQNSALKGNISLKSGTMEQENGYYELNSKLIKYQNDGLVCPYDLKEICSKFVTKNSLKELVQEIGLFGSNGIPMLVPSVSPYLTDPTLMVVPSKVVVVGTGEEPKIDEQRVFIANAELDNSSPRACAANGFTGSLKSDKPPFGSLEQKDGSVSCHSLDPALGNCCVIPESALRPLVGKASVILRRLKIDLLDMDAALPEVALRPSKAHLERRWAWRSFVKSADTIHEMVQAVVAFEDLIKTEYLKKTWWYWSSLSAAAKISTLSSLSLRIYSLDVSINYEKGSVNLDKRKLSDNKPDHKPESVSGATEKLQLGKKQQKRKREQLEV
ncbi:methyl-CpG-binding domain-containing protein 9 isoform X2 [Rhododendron vialii]|uniref:methyl-CpG-binding domain-containing protein 9 isoform X2 n=1 Tax=Rhododendron vialii TaxID=182163 RepID=UPI00265F2977|nr:methyl-CpG-binding domain-containing protein 9 isoform X2 [Rhododendron vialii]